MNNKEISLSFSLCGFGISEVVIANYLQKEFYLGFLLISVCTPIYLPNKVTSLWYRRNRL